MNPRPTLGLDEEALKFYDAGLKEISNGTFATVMCTGSWRKLKPQEPILLNKPDWSLDMTVLEAYLEKLKAVGQQGSPV